MNSKKKSLFLPALCAFVKFVIAAIHLSAVTADSFPFFVNTFKGNVSVSVNEKKIGKYFVQTK